MHLAATDGGMLLRQEIWVTTKLNVMSGDRRQARITSRQGALVAAQRCLNELGLTYVDLLLIHGTAATNHQERVAVWKGLVEARTAGIARHIGVSAFSQQQVEELVSATGVLPETIHLEYHPWVSNAQKELFSWCKARNIAVVAYNSLGGAANRGRVGADVLGIAMEHKVNPAQVLLAWGLTNGAAVIPGSLSPEHMIENLKATKLSLSPKDLEHLATSERPRQFKRYNPPGSGSRDERSFPQDSIPKPTSVMPKGKPASLSTVDWSELDTRGYVWLESFIDDRSLLEAVWANWQRSAYLHSAMGGTFAPDSPPVRAVKARLASLTASIRRASTQSRPDPETALCANKSMYFLRGEPPRFNQNNQLAAMAAGIEQLDLSKAQSSFGLHTDRATSWDATDRSADYLNLYIALKKSGLADQRREGNLDVLPFDRLQSSTRDSLLNQAYQVFDIVGQRKKSMKLRDVLGCQTPRRLNTSDVLGNLETPELREGDLLVLRGDTPHATGAVGTAGFKLAMSVRVWQYPKAEAYIQSLRGRVGRCAFRRAQTLHRLSIMAMASADGHVDGMRDVNCGVGPYERADDGISPYAAVSMLTKSTARVQWSFCGKQHWAHFKGPNMSLPQCI